MADYTPLIDRSIVDNHALSLSLIISGHVLWITFLMLMVCAAVSLYRLKSTEPRSNLNIEGIPLVMISAAVSTCFALVVFVFSIALISPIGISTDTYNKSVNSKTSKLSQ